MAYISKKGPASDRHMLSLAGLVGSGFVAAYPPPVLRIHPVPFPNKGFTFEVLLRGPEIIQFPIAVVRVGF